jgi:hypothetical protein
MLHILQRLELILLILIYLLLTNLVILPKINIIIFDFQTIIINFVYEQCYQIITDNLVF